MREILFRGKRTDNGKWVEGLLWKKKYNHDKIFISYFPDEDDHEDAVVVSPETVGQYTGMVDYEDNRIWEDDIIKEGCNGLVGRVIWDNKLGTYRLAGLGEDYVIKDARLEWEVIGNIHDNPELIGGE